MSGAVPNHGGESSAVRLDLIVARGRAEACEAFEGHAPAALPSAPGHAAGTLSFSTEGHALGTDLDSTEAQITRQVQTPELRRRQGCSNTRIREHPTSVREQASEQASEQGADLESVVGDHALEELEVERC
eukprot:1174333-Rhodomonas_salina.3